MSEKCSQTLEDKSEDPGRSNADSPATKLLRD